VSASTMLIGIEPRGVTIPPKKSPVRCGRLHPEGSFLLILPKLKVFTALPLCLRLQKK
jgi:hypothetical protein